MVNVLLVEPWMAGSHEAWAEGYQRHSRHRVEVLGERPRGWRDAIDSSAPRLATRVSSQPDVVVATSMLDLMDFQEQSGLGDTPTLLYFHENQLTYDRATPDRERGAISWRSARAADRVAFNSRFHLDDFFDALTGISAAPADVDQQRAAAMVLPVGIEPPPLTDPPDGPLTILWNHRWEHDKDPETFVAALHELAGLPFEVILLGEGRSAGRYHEQITANLGDRVVHAGYAPTPAYRTLLAGADIVVSTALQEFFGVSIAEAMAAGAAPLVPDRLAYPELLGPDLTTCLYQPGTLAGRLESAINDPAEIRSWRPAAHAAGARFDWKLVAPDYDRLIDSMI